MDDQHEDILLDHSYDGIQEYDNPLPSWWVLIFWVTILFCPFYWLYYEIGVGPSIQENAAQESVEYLQLLEKQLEGITIDEAYIASLQKEEQLMGGMSGEFSKWCTSCHGPNGEGQVGPNLTDAYWKHGGDLMAIYETISKGVDGTQMQAQTKNLGVMGTLYMTAWLGMPADRGGMRNKNLPGGRPPEGSLYEPNSEDREASDAPSNATEPSSSDR